MGQQSVSPGTLGTGSFRSRGAAALGLPMLFGYLLLGDLAWSLKERAMPDLFKFQLSEFSQEALLLNVLFGALPAAIAMLIGPLVGGWSDRTRTRYGRRIPFLVVCAPLVSASMVGLAFSAPAGEALWRWQGAAPGEQGRYIVACMCLFWTLYEIFTILTNALFVALVNDTVPHRILGRFFGMFRIVSLGVGALFYYFVFSNELPALARPAMLAIAAAYLLGFMVLCRGVREPAYPPPPPAARASLLDGVRSAGTGFHLLLFAAVAIATVCVLPVNINSYNAIDQFGVSRTDYGRAVAAAYGISIVLAMPVGWLADRFHPLRVGLVALGLYALSMLVAWGLVSGRISFLVWFMAHSVLAGTFLTGTAALLPLLLPRAHFSSLAALSASVTALLTVFFTLGMGMLLDANGRDFHVMFLVAGVLATLGALCWYRLLRCCRGGLALSAQRS